MASHPSPSQPGSAAANYKRASRRGAPRRFICEHPGCDKLYSRAEHLQRHQLNHNPKEIFICDVPGCDQKFVRADLLSRHKKRHSSSYIPRNRAPSFASAASGTQSGPVVSSPTAGAPPRPAFPQPSTSGPHDAAILLTPDSATPTPTTGASNPSLAQHVNRISQPTTWPSIDDMAVEMMRPKPAYYGRDQMTLPEAPPLMPSFDPRGFQPDEALSRENFAVWLFDSQASFSDFNGVANLPFLEGGLESTFNNNIPYDYESLTSRSQLDPTPPRQVEVSDELISEHRRQEVLRWLKVFRHKQPKTWWVRWAESESMHRVVFAAFMMDTVHAAMFGHNADMAPHEIRLPLPCDDGLWTAATPNVFRQLDGNYRMYGIKQVSFLDGLKSALHGQEVKTHTFGRMIIMSGLLSVGWHLSRRESHLKWLDLRTPSTETHDSWKKILFRAFDEWKESFDSAVGANDLSEGLGQPPSSNGPIHSAAVLYHLAHISLHVDIVDCQVYAGAKRLVGRKVSTRDHANAVARMRTWSNAPSTRHAVLHAFRLLYRVLVDHKNPKRRTSSFGALPEPVSVYYSCRSEPDPHRPWIMYYAALTIWSFVQALGIPNRNTPPGRYSEIARYLAYFSSLEELNEEATRDLNERLPELLDLLETSLKQSHSELLREASERLKLCREMLV
ncbi:hypothetical protein COL5a_000307 [Colletotrichum fioriniae]|nr:hypothetical protein COL5a_000307 [Colletotrichum fioriniae]